MYVGNKPQIQLGLQWALRFYVSFSLTSCNNQYKQHTINRLLLIHKNTHFTLQSVPQSRSTPQNRAVGEGGHHHQWDKWCETLYLVGNSLVQLWKYKGFFLRLNIDCHTATNYEFARCAASAALNPRSVRAEQSKRVMFWVCQISCFFYYWLNLLEANIQYIMTALV